MTAQELHALLEEVRAGKTAATDAARRVIDAMSAAPFDDLGFARMDTHWHLRQGSLEVILGLGKTPAQIAAIAGRIDAHGHSLLITRATRDAYDAVRAVVPDAEYREQARAIVARRGDILAFVEVKARGDYEKAGFSLHSRQFGRVARAASLFLAHHPRYAAHSLRFDAVLVVGLWPRHLPDVWRAPE